MSQNLTISETGLKLIKAFEGYRPVDRELITGQRIVGYGHRLYSEDAVMMNKGEAETVLRSDLEPFEDMINTEVHAPMTQSQFDALCSFAFNIGPKAFLQSDTLRAINNGRPLDAANGLDVWRKSEIAGKTYVVDALMRRRTAEKALFLRTEKSVPAGRANLPPVKDDKLIGLSTDDGLPILTEEQANGIVATAPYTASDRPSRRREDGPAGTLRLSERDIIEEGDVEDIEIIAADSAAELEASDDVVTLTEAVEDAALDLQDEIVLEDKPRKSPIAAAATDIVARLDALIEDVDARFEGTEDEWPDRLIDESASETEDIISDDIISDEIMEVELDDKVIDLTSASRRSSDLMDEASSRVDIDSDKAAFDKSDDLSSGRQAAHADEKTPVKVIDELAQDDAIRVRTDSAAKYIQQIESEEIVPEPKQPNNLGLWIPILLGFILVGLSGGAMISNSAYLLGEWGEIITFTGLVIGLGLILAGVYAELRTNLSR